MRHPTSTAWAPAGDEDFQFHRVQDATRVGNGSIAVVDQSRALRLFDSEGMLLWTAGGEGDGPGEFRFPVMVGELAGDSLVVWDGAANRLSIFTLGGQFVRDAAARNLGGYTRALGLSGARALLVQAIRGERARIDGHEALVHPADIYLVNLDGAIARELGRRIFTINFQEVDEDGAFSPAIFATSAVIGASPDGFWYGDTKEYALREEVGPDRTRRIVRWAGPDRTVTNRDVQAVLEKWIEDADDPAARRFLVEYGETHPRADAFPAYQKLHIDGTGRLWVQDYVKAHGDDGSRRWTVLSADGTRILGRLTHPAAIELHDVGDDWLLAVERDELDVEWIALYGIVRES